MSRSTSPHLSPLDAPAEAVVALDGVVAGSPSSAAEPSTAKPGAAAKSRRRLFLALKIGVTALLLAWVMRGTRFADIWAAASRANGSLLLTAFSLQFAGIWISAKRWRALLRAQGADASIWYLSKSFMVGSFFNNFLPSTIGGDAIRIYDSYRAGTDRAAAVAVIMVDRLLGLLVLMLFALAGLALSPRLTAGLPLLGLWVVAGTIALAATVGLIFLPTPGRNAVARFAAHLPTPLRGIAAKVGGAFAAFTDRHRTLAAALGWSVALQANVVLFYVLVAWSLGLAIAWYNFFLIVSLALVIALLPISINGIGLRENTFVFLLAAFGVAGADALAFSWLAYLTLLGGSVLGGVVYALRR